MNKDEYKTVGDVATELYIIIQEGILPPHLACRLSEVADDISEEWEAEQE